MNTEFRNSTENTRAPARGSNSAVIANMSRRWQYNGAAPFDVIIAWCHKHFEHVTWSYLNETIYFKNEKEYAFFLLRWS